MKTLRENALFLLLPLGLAAFYLESRLVISQFDHALVDILIVILICVLAWIWVGFDERARLRKIMAEPSRAQEPKLLSGSQSAPKPAYRSNGRAIGTGALIPGAVMKVRPQNWRTK